MMTRRIALSCMFAAAAMMGCAAGHATMRGSVVMKIDPTTAHVCLGNGEVTVTDRVRLYKNVCALNSQQRWGGACKKTPVAEGTVTQLLDEHYSVVTFPAGTTLEEGNTVEKL